MSQLVFAEKPYVRIHHCQTRAKSESMSSQDYACNYEVPRHKDEFQLNCTVKGTKRDIDMSWNQPDNESYIYKERSDGTFDETITIVIQTADLADNLSNFTCTCPRTLCQRNCKGHHLCKSGYRLACSLVLMIFTNQNRNAKLYEQMHQNVIR